jgi:hypothetical protein
MRRGDEKTTAKGEIGREETGFLDYMHRQMSTMATPMSHAPSRL